MSLTAGFFGRYNGKVLQGKIHLGSGSVHLKLSGCFPL